jgi:hypothetical protein
MGRIYLTLDVRHQKRELPTNLWDYTISLLNQTSLVQLWRGLSQATGVGTRNVIREVDTARNPDGFRKLSQYDHIYSKTGQKQNLKLDVTLVVDALELGAAHGERITAYFETRAAQANLTRLKNALGSEVKLKLKLQTKD